MSEEEIIKEFLEKHINHNDFGYLVICRDQIYIQEAVEKIRNAFNEFRKSKGGDL